ncbi:amidohydrolase family protein [Microbacterium sp. B2969]|uniref:Amidohydrolase family protein n=1 Tax=Microbacterium alkaliflavum TaxID=3248839 RepID=A0ABW7Q599_9MICO
MTAVGDRVSTISGVRIVGPGSELLPDEGPFDVFLDGEVIADIAPAGALRPRGLVLDGEGAWLIPGLWDHHVHVMQWALVSQRAPLGHASSAAQAASLMGDAAIIDGRRVGTGFRDAFWTDEPTLDLLDAATGETPTYLINADVHSVWLNSAALRREGFESGSGLLREEPAFEISRRLNLVDPATGDLLVEQMARDAASRGVVGLVDLDMAWNEDAWSRRTRSGFDTLRVEFGIYPEHLARALADGLQTGDVARGAASDLACVGSLKVITDGSLGTRTAATSHAYPGDPHNHGLLTVDPATLLDLMTQAVGGGISCAIHAIGDVANSHALDAFAVSGATGTIEHAQLVAHADIPRFGKLGVGASVQPEHAIDDRDLTDTIWAGQTAQPYPLAALAATGANLLLGSDAPVSPLDPWAALAAAVYRTRDGREPWQPTEALDAATALAASTHGGSRAADVIAVGARADLALCATNPLTATATELRAMTVAATLVGARLTHGG